MLGNNPIELITLKCNVLVSKAGNKFNAFYTHVNSSNFIQNLRDLARRARCCFEGEISWLLASLSPTKVFRRYHFHCSFGYFTLIYNIDSFVCYEPKVGLFVYCSLGIICLLAYTTDLFVYKAIRYEHRYLMTNCNLLV